ncbi:MAG TPA: class I tRNA ligase family protein, partial [bacterium]|nr:class I tRNA ligase family protein [bacterium]
TGFDIIFFWVARMIMMGLKFGGDVPFDKVYFHGMVRDEKGHKMSKTRGNVIDPLEITEKYGADALRFTFAMMPLTARDLKLSMAQIEGYAGFCNKIFNAIRFSLMQFGEGEVVEFDPATYKEDAFTPADKWILTRLGEVTDEVTRGLDEYRLTEAAGAVYHFFWHEFCDWYIELAKPTLQGYNAAEKEATKKVLLKVIDTSLRLLHPFMPFITEELWQALPYRSASRRASIMIADFPKSDECPRFATDAEAMERIVELITTIRTIRAESNVKPSLEAPVILVTADAAAVSALKARESYLKKLARVSSLSFETAHAPAKTDASAVVKLGTLYLPLAGLVDFGEEVKRIEKELAKLRKDFQIAEQKLGSESFLAKARPELVEQEKVKHADLKGKIAHLEKRLTEIG